MKQTRLTDFGFINPLTREERLRINAIKDYEMEYRDNKINRTELI
jgi:hypothetical protein